MKNLMIILITLLSFQTYADTVVFKQAGFSIDILDSVPGEAGSQPLTMLLPSVDGFAANINVQIQPYSGSLEDYKKLSESQFSALSLETLNSTFQNNELYLEYKGLMQSKHLHFYAKAIKKGKFIYLATATDLESNWSNTLKKSKSIINSFVIN